MPSPPGVALEIIRLHQRDNINIDALSAVLIRGPAIVTKLLRMANSSNSGRPDQVFDVRQAIQAGHALGLLMLDIGHFKSVNDDHGHPCGDDLLRGISAATVASRSSDDVAPRPERPA
ncbi:MAG TPA: HDOD domain-containing protein [Myxococcales bacterium]|nr:HDOD domain-containing protein [Myxococcales bacterium]HIL99416.1 HDOD domain-containing protein [Myxococcales bacterium]